VLDLGLPDLDGTDVITELRTSTPVPIIVLSARTDSTDKVHALDRGADDYVTKPFGVGELMVRLRAAVRRATAPVNPADAEVPLQAGDLVIDLAAKMVCRDGQQVRLTPTEWSILELLARNHGKLVSRNELLHHIWGPTDRKETSYLRVYVGQLRHMLEADPARPRHLITEAGMGYRFHT
jgi:two-component system, OmpR family, KDP operon response regulator KdpE